MCVSYIYHIAHVSHKLLIFSSCLLYMYHICVSCFSYVYHVFIIFSHMFLICLSYVSHMAHMNLSYYCSMISSRDVRTVETPLSNSHAGAYHTLYLHALHWLHESRPGLPRQRSLKIRLPRAHPTGQMHEVVVERVSHQKKGVFESKGALVS